MGANGVYLRAALAGDAKAVKAGRWHFPFQEAFLADESKSGVEKHLPLEKLRSWLKSLPPAESRSVAAAIAARAALRVVPLIAKEPYPWRPLNGESSLHSATFAIFFTAALVRIAPKFPVQSNELRAIEALIGIVTNRSVGIVDEDVILAANQAAFATHAAASGFETQAFNATLATIANCSHATFQSSVDGDFWWSISRDRDFITSGGTAKLLALEPLWVDGVPERAAGRWQRLQMALPREDDWQVWIDWFNRRLEGVSDSKEVELVFATVPEKEREAGPAAANKWIKERLEELQKKDAPPQIPRQGPGPHVEVDAETGAVVPAKPESLDDEGNNLARLNAQHPQIVRYAGELLANLGQNEQPELFAAAKNYFDTVDRDLSEIDFERLWGEGVYLEEAEAAAARRIADALREPLNDTALTALGALVQLHKSFILATKAGLENLAAANAYDLRPKEEEDRRAATLEFVRKSEDYPDVIAPETAAVFKHFAEQPEATARPERGAAFRAGMTRNTLVVVASTVSVGAILAGVAHYTATPFAAVIGLPLIEGLKKAKPFLEVSRLVESAVNELSENDARRLAERLRKIPFERYKQFVLDNEALLRRLAGSGKQSRWLHEHLDWLKRTSEPPKW